MSFLVAKYLYKTGSWITMGDKFNAATSVTLKKGIWL